MFLYLRSYMVKNKGLILTSEKCFKVSIESLHVVFYFYWISFAWKWGFKHTGGISEQHDFYVLQDNLFSAIFFYNSCDNFTYSYSHLFCRQVSVFRVFIGFYEFLIKGFSISFVFMENEFLLLLIFIEANYSFISF